MREVVKEYASYTSGGEIELFFDDGAFFGTIEESAGNTCGERYYFSLKDIQGVTTEWEIRDYFQKNPHRIDEAKEYFCSYSFGKIILSENEIFYF